MVWLRYQWWCLRRWWHAGQGGRHAIKLVEHVLAFEELMQVSPDFEYIKVEAVIDAAYEHVLKRRN